MRRLSVLVLCVVAGIVAASDWPHWQGVNHDGASDEKMPVWPAGGPKELWRKPIGEGLGEVAVSGGKCFIMAETQGGEPAAPPAGGGGGRRGGGAGKGGQESVLCFDANGTQLWAAPVGPTILRENQGNDGPRSTPAVDGNYVYAVGTYLNIVCLDASQNGKVVWGHDCAAEFGADVQLKAPGIGAWGCANSPVIDGDLVFVHCGGRGQALMAFNKKDGKVAWKGEGDLLTHSTPAVATILGTRQVIFFTQTGLVSLEPTSGKVLWRFAEPYKVSTAISPVVCGDIVFCASGYNVGAAAARISKIGDTLKATELWRDNKLPVHWSTPVCANGYIYGIFSQGNPGNAPLKCVEAATGKTLWSQDGMGQGGTTLVDGKLVVQTARGAILLVEASEKGYKELAKTEVLKGKCWNQATVANGRMYARSTKELVCFDVSGK